ncbi:MAG: YciI family protein [Isosphaeraceae bacterium]
MRVMIIGKATKETEAGLAWEDKEQFTRVMAEMGKFNEELLKAGVLLAAEGLHPSSKGVRVQFSGDKKTVIDGPFAEAKELIAGYQIWEVKSMEEAIEWVKRFPNCSPTGESEIEIRPVVDMADFAEVMAPDHLERAQNLRKTAYAKE